MADKPRTTRRHKTHAPALTAEDVKFAQLLFEARAATEHRATVAECYLQAGFPAKATPHATEQAAHRRVKKREFREFYRVLQDSAAAHARLVPSLLTRGLMRIALFDLRQLFDADGLIKPMSQWTEADAAGVMSVETEEIFEWVTAPLEEGGPPVKQKVLRGYNRKVKRVAPVEAMKTLAQILRLIGADAEVPQAAAAPLVVGGEASPDKLFPPESP